MAQAALNLVMSLFQSTHPRGVRRSTIVIRCRRSDDFNPRTHEGCDVPHRFNLTFVNLFQSTHPRGVRHQVFCSVGIINYISIHAPTRGATLFKFRGFILCHHFNPRTHEGCDCCVYFKCICILDFNPRTHEGCDFGCPSRTKTGCYFNPRTHEGCDRKAIFPYPGFAISIHAPTRGATAVAAVAVCKSVYFNPRTHEGCDQWLRWKHSYMRTFQSTHPRGVRRKTGGKSLKNTERFQSTHPRGVRPDFPPFLIAQFSISIHAPTRGATRVRAKVAVPGKFQSTHPRGVRQQNCTIA